ncbi:MAG: IS1634 family transposase [Cyanobacteria bacterium P01_H01_bin.58]
MSSELRVANLDHLGIIAGLVDALGIVEQVNQHVSEDTREQVSAGVIVKAMILNGLGFVSAPLYLFEDFFAGKPTEHLLGPGILPEHLNDDRLGRVLDLLYRHGLSELFVMIGMQAVERFGVERRTMHLDATSFAVEGDYVSLSDVTTTDGPMPIQITHGYSREHRPDLKQFVLNLVCWSDGDIPGFLELADGNQSDKARFAELMQTFRQQWQFDGLCVADAALYSEANLQKLAGLHWLTRVPLTVKAADELVTQLPESALEPTDLEGYRIATVCNYYGQVRQRWFVVESQVRQQADLKQLTKTLQRVTEQTQAELDKLGAQAFACKADAANALQQFEQRLKWHQLSQKMVATKRSYDAPGRPKLETPPRRVTYHAQATLSLNPAVVAQHQQRAGRFILATNILVSQDLTASEALQDYKEQQGSERGFRFLKDPLFFTASVFLKSAERIMALAMIMGLCLMVYNLGQRQLRQALQQAEQTLPNQLGKGTQAPTLRWIFQCFMAVHYVVLNDEPQIVNLNDVRRHILAFLGAPCRRYYLMC